MQAARDTVLNPIAALAACALAGAACAAIRMPLPWMIGPMLAMAACNAAGAGLRAPGRGREVGQVVIGTALGLYFTPVVAREVASLWHILVVAAILAIAIGASCGWVLSRLSGTDRSTAFFASIPGGATEMAVLAERFGARVDHVAFAQSLRILMVVVVIPFSLTFSGVHGADSHVVAVSREDPAGLVQLLALTLAGGATLHVLRVPNPFMFGPLLVSSLLSMLEVQFSSMPIPLSNAGQLLLGCALGARFGRRSLGSLPLLAASVAASVVAAMAFSTAVAFAISKATGVPFPTLVLAVAPGGIAEMCITAKVLQLGVPLVTAAHVVRVVVLVSATGWVYQVALRLGSRIRN